VSAAEITAICTGVPAIISAVAALVYAWRGSTVATATRTALVKHITEEHGQ
jgi:hypothetical protein